MMSWTRLFLHLEILSCVFFILLRVYPFLQRNKSKYMYLNIVVQAIIWTTFTVKKVPVLLFSGEYSSTLINFSLV